MSRRALHLRITGRVQGGGYRAWIIERAAALGLCGWVRNRGDGRVEALVIGDDAPLAAIVAACREGPRWAAVRQVEARDADDDGSAGFTAKPTG